MSVLGMIGSGAASAAASTGLGMINQQNQMNKNKQMARYNQKLNKEMFDYTYNKTNTTAQMQQLKANNLNPTLMYGGGGGGTTQPTVGNAVGGDIGMVNNTGLQDAIGGALAMAQIDNIKADTEQKKADTITTDETRPFVKELMKQQGVREWIDNNRKIFLDKKESEGEGGDERWNYNEVLDREHQINNGSLFGRQATQDVLKAIAETGNAEAQALLTNEKAKNYFREIINQTMLAEAAKQNADTNKADLANKEIQANAAKITAEFGAGEIMNTKQIIQLATQIVNSLSIVK